MSPFYEEQPIIRRSIGDEERKYHVVPTTSSRTQHKLQLQRLFVLTNDKNYLDHPKNMKRLTKEIDRVNREYRCVRRFEDPVQESFRRLGQKVECEKSIHNKQIHTSHTSATSISRSQSHSSSTSSSNSSSYSSSADQNSFIGRWFAHQENDHNPTSSQTNHKSIIDINSVVYSFHPTIANSMKRKTKH